MSDTEAKKRPKKTSPTARTLAWCRARGWLAGVVERRIPRSFVTQDLFGFADVAAINPHRGRVVLIQACAGTDVARRQAKLSGERTTMERPLAAPEPEKEREQRARVAEAVRLCVAAGVLVEVWGWRRLLVKRGGKAVRWEVMRRRATVTAGDLIEWEDVDG